MISRRFVAQNTATSVRDENLEGSLRRGWKAQGGTEATTRSILELSTLNLQLPLVLSRWDALMMVKYMKRSTTS